MEITYRRCPSCGTMDIHHFENCKIHESPRDWIIVPIKPTLETEDLILVARENGLKEYVNYPWNNKSRRLIELVASEVRRYLNARR